MVTLNKRGEVVVDAQLEAQAERKGQEIIYVMDSELKELLIKQNKLLNAILAIEAYGKNLSANEEDYN